MNSKEIAQDIMERLALFRLSEKGNLFNKNDLVILIPERDFITLMKGYADYINIAEAEITFQGIRCRRTKENKIIVGVEG